MIAGTPMVGAATLIALWSPYTTLALIAALALFYVFGVGSSSVAESGVAGKPKATQRAAATLCLRGTGAGSRGCANRSLRTPSRHQKTEPGARAASRLRSSAESAGIAGGASGSAGTTSEVAQGVADRLRLEHRRDHPGVALPAVFGPGRCGLLMRPGRRGRT